MNLTFFVPGIPQPKGSGSRIASGVYLEAGTSASRKRKVSWYAKVADAALRAWKPPLVAIRAPVTVKAVLRFPIPKSRSRGKRALAPGDPHISAPDADKLARSLGDSLTRSGVIADDRLIATWFISKVYVAQGDEGADVTLTW
jgi:Holliday junction resolvase RusA-like endonuclease